MKLSDNIKFLRSRMYLFAGILVAVAIILYILVNRSTLNVVFTPSLAIVTLDNAPVNALPNGTAKITTKPGAHTLKVEADGYAAQILNLDLQGGRSKSLKIDLVKIPEPLVLPFNTITDIPVNNISLGDEDNSVFYLGNNKSAIYKVKFNADKTIQIVSQVTNPGLSGINEIIWSPSKDAALFKKGSSAYFFDFQKFNFVSQQETKFGDDIGDVAWSPDNSKIAYSYAPASGERSLIFADRSNTVIRRALNFNDLNIQNPYLVWSPSSELILIIPRNTDPGTNKIYMYNAYTTEFKSITDTGNNTEASFSPDGNKIIFSSVSNDPTNPVKSALSIMNSDGTEIKDLGIKANVSKVAWIDNSNIAIATFDPETTKEVLFRYNVDSRQKTGFSIPLAGIFVNSMLVSPDKKTLYFMANSKLYQTGL